MQGFSYLCLKIAPKKSLVMETKNRFIAPFFIAPLFVALNGDAPSTWPRNIVSVITNMDLADAWLYIDIERRTVWINTKKTKYANLKFIMDISLISSCGEDHLAFYHPLKIMENSYIYGRFQQKWFFEVNMGIKIKVLICFTPFSKSKYI